MPSRIIRDSIRTSDTLAQITGDEERHFWRLVTQADDHGRFDARAYVIRAESYAPILDQVSEEESERRTLRLAEVGLIQLYHVDGKRYGWFVTWGKHQRPPRSVSKYPPPPADVDTCEQLLTSADNGEQLPPSAARKREAGSGGMELGSGGMEAGSGSSANAATAAAALQTTANTSSQRPEWLAVLVGLEGPDEYQEGLMLKWARDRPSQILLDTAFELASKWPEERFKSRNGVKKPWTTFQAWVRTAEKNPQRHPSSSTGRSHGEPGRGSEANSQPGEAQADSLEQRQQQAASNRKFARRRRGPSRDPPP